MKTTLTSLFLLITLYTGVVFASETACCSDCDSGFSVYADYLYWKVCETDLTYSTQEPDGQNTVDITNYLNPDYNSGWRIGGRYNCNYWDIGVRYTDYCNTKKVTFDYQINQNETEERIQTFKFDWSVVDIELGYNLPFNCDRYTLRPFVGVKLAWIKESFDDQQDDEFSKQDFDGYGLYLGAEGRFLFCRTNVCSKNLELSLLCRGSYGILDSTSDTKSIFDNNSNNNVTDRKPECLFISTVEVFAGLDVAFKCSECFRPHILVGYESHTMIGWREMNSSNDRATLGLGGLVTRFDVEF